MKLTRRLVLSGSAALIAAAALPLGARRAWAVTTAEFGDSRIDSLSDGQLELPAQMTLDALPAADRDAMVAQFNLPTSGIIVSPLNVTLLRQGDRVVLFDVGSGPDFVPTAGKLAEALAAVEVAPEDVTDVIFTHGHPDHLWGLLDEFDEPLFANARLQMGRTEHAFWTDPGTVETIGEERQSFAAGAARRLKALGERMEVFAHEGEVLPGIAAVRTPGHTPGHTSYAIGTPEAGIFVTGDAVTSVLGFARPQIGSATDHDPPMAAATRAALLARLADDRWRILGYHLPDGGIGRVERDGDSYKFVAEI